MEESSQAWVHPFTLCSLFTCIDVSHVTLLVKNCPSEVIQLPAATGKTHLPTLSGIGPLLLMGEIGLKEGAEPKSSQGLL